MEICPRQSASSSSGRILQNLKSGLVKTRRQSLKILCLNSNLTSSTTEISSSADADSEADVTRLQSVVTDQRIDGELMTFLTQNDVINWTQQTCRLAPLKHTKTSGDGLLWSVVVSIWNALDQTSDLELFLQRLLHVSLTTGRQNSSFQERWKLEHFDDNPSQADWMDVCAVFGENGISNSTFWMESLDSIDQIHLFSMSNILRRPILVIADISRSSSEEERSKDLSGVYLPVLSDPEDCVPHPLILVCHRGVFHPILVRKIQLEEGRMMPFQSVPLVRFDQAPFHIRCLLSSEQKRAHELMTSYLKVAEISRNPGSGSSILTARLSSGAVKTHFQSPLSPSSVSGGPKSNVRGHLDSDEVRFERFVPQEQLETKHQFEAKHLNEVENVQVVENTKRKQSTGASNNLAKCVTTGCKNEASEKYQNRCFACYVRNDDVDEKASGKPRKTELSHSGSHRSKEIPHDSVYKQHQRSTHEKRRKDEEVVLMKEKDNLFEATITEEVKEKERIPRIIESSEDILKSDEISDPSSDIEILENSSQDADNDEKLFATSENRPSKSNFSENCLVFKQNDPVSAVKDFKSDNESNPKSESCVKKSKESVRKCIVDFCENTGDDLNKGLCKVCYDTLRAHRLQKQDDKKSSEVRCLTEGCLQAVTNHQLKLCLSCLRMQIFAARDMERRRASCSSQRSPSSSSSSPSSGRHLTALPIDSHRSSSPKRRTLKSTGDVLAETEERMKIQYQKRSSLQKISSRNDRRSICMIVDCGRCADPDCHGFCSRCFEKFSRSYGKAFE